jgi:hypothetical protein
MFAPGCAQKEKAGCRTAPPTYPGQLERHQIKLVEFCSVRPFSHISIRESIACSVSLEKLIIPTYSVLYYDVFGSVCAISDVHELTAARLASR